MKSDSKGMAGGLVAMQSLIQTTNQAPKVLSLYKESIGTLEELGTALVAAISQQLVVLSSGTVTDEKEQTEKMFVL